MKNPRVPAASVPLLLTLAALPLGLRAPAARAQPPNSPPPAPIQDSRHFQETLVIGARLGTLGLGVDAVVSVTETFAVRGGAGFMGWTLDVTGRFGLADNRTAELALVDGLYTLGGEASLGFMRLGAGLLVKSGNPVHTITYGQGAAIDIGGNPYTQPQVRTIETTVESKSTAPYLTLTFGSGRSKGFNFDVDIGAALLRGADVTMTATGDVVGSAAFKTDLEAERLDTKNDIGVFRSFWPIMNLVLAYGF